MSHPRKRPLGRPPVRTPAIANSLREHIVSGKWAPGQRVPTRRELCRRLDCSPITMQQAMDILAAEGFVVSRVRNGTVVSDAPPHLADIAVVFSRQHEGNRFFAALAGEAQRPRDDALRTRCWDEIDEHIDNLDRQALADDVEHQRLAGIFFASNPFFLEGSPILLRPGMPRVAIMGRPATPPHWPAMGCVTLAPRFADRAIEHLCARGCRRIAVIETPRGTGRERWEAALARHGRQLEPWAYQTPSRDQPEAARWLTRLLFRDGQSAPPDGLVIGEDNLVEAVTGGLADSATAAEPELPVVAHCNYPLLPTASHPVTWLGFDARRVFAAGIDLLQEIAAGTPPRTITVDVSFEHEV